MVGFAIALAVIALMAVTAVIVFMYISPTSPSARQRISMEETYANARLRNIHNDAMRKMNDTVRDFIDVDEEPAR